MSSRSTEVRGEGERESEGGESKSIRETKGERDKLLADIGNSGCEDSSTRRVGQQCRQTRAYKPTKPVALPCICQYLPATVISGRGACRTLRPSLRVIDSITASDPHPMSTTLTARATTTTTTSTVLFQTWSTSSISVEYCFIATQLRSRSPAVYPFSPFALFFSAEQGLRRL
ncbi:hypothetical protein SISSUDRAFT_795460 [Sistotremastrum suecicum HHB10207 ss-3]|uniref:Uncharacterized protein n=1 Tax=Sistotremastrum suecicum HHB10207 ss-3 TaxID=1314776 RepID=A0A166HP73_9AGAM|nr:hypothetical protein SISSUDRAFT_795460 [Sistotremastrum suecicum HHB10207 ss-3]